MLNPEKASKHCTRCGEERPLDNFRVTGGYRHSWCRLCVHAYDSERHTQRQQDPAYREAAMAKSTAWYLANKERALEQQRKRNYAKKYGITIEDYDRMLTEQGGCAICGRESPASEGIQRNRRYFAIDHDHKTGRVRGLLCDPCNRGIGLFYEDPEKLRSAILYLQRHADPPHLDE